MNTIVTEVEATVYTLADAVEKCNRLNANIKDDKEYFVTDKRSDDYCLVLKIDNMAPRGSRRIGFYKEQGK